MHGLRDAEEDKTGHTRSHNPGVGAMASRGKITHALARQRPPSQPTAELLSCMSTGLSPPTTLGEALELDHADIWNEATANGHGRLYDAGTFGEEQQPKGSNFITTKWVYTRKSAGHGKVVQGKARLVARGYRQHEGIILWRYLPQHLSRLLSVCYLLLHASVV